MRRTWLAWLVTVLVLGTTAAAQAQHRIWPADAECGCNACAPVQMAHGGCCPPLLPTVVQGLHKALSGLFCCPGLNARHDIYRAALNRNDFGKCGFPLFPVYARQRCGCGSVNAGCPHCGTAHGAVEEVIEMGEVPGDMLLEPTPATEPEARRRPSSIPRAATPQPGMPTVSSPAGRQAALRDRVARGDNQESRADAAPQPGRYAATSAKPRTTHPIRRTGLLEAPAIPLPSNTLRK